VPAAVIAGAEFSLRSCMGSIRIPSAAAAGLFWKERARGQSTEAIVQDRF
jgi:hypothetical protein